LVAFSLSVMAPKKHPATFYKVVNGVKFDKALLEKAEKAAADGQISLAEAKELWTAAHDEGVVTKCEQRTIEHCLKEMKFSPGASDYLKKELASLKKATNTGYYKTVDGVRYDKQLLEAGEESQKSGATISIAEAKEIWEMAKDSAGITKIERRTLDYLLKELKFTPAAKMWVLGEMGKTADKPVEEGEEDEPAKPTEPAEEKKEEAAKEDKIEEKEDSDSGEDMDEPAPAAKAAPAAKEVVLTEEQKKEKKKKDREAAERKKKADKRKKGKEKKKATKEAEFKEKLKLFKEGKGPNPNAAKGKGKGNPKGVAPKAMAKKDAKKDDDMDDIEIDYVVPEVLEGMEDDSFQSVKDRFTPMEVEGKDEKDDDEDDEDKPKKRAKPKTSLLDEAEASDDDDDGE